MLFLFCLFIYLFLDFTFELGMWLLDFIWIGNVIDTFLAYFKILRIQFVFGIYLEGKVNI